MADFAGKTVLVTGGAGGLGREIAEAFLRGGAFVVLADIDAERLARTCDDLGKGASSITVDLADEASIHALAKTFTETHGQLDVLVNNAGLAYGDVATELFGIGMADWQRYLTVNTIAPLLLAEALRGPLAKASGIVINQSSMASYVPGTAYGVTKAALNAVTFGLAMQLGAEGIRCVAIAPGMMETDASREALGTDMIRGLAAMQLAPARQGTPRDIANLCLFLASNEGSFINNEVISVDGGHRMRGFRG